jgi:hypothetical protein
MTKRSLGIAALLALAACSPAADETNIAIDNEVNAAEAAGADVETLPPDDAVESENLEDEEDPDNGAGMPPPNESR